MASRASTVPVRGQGPGWGEVGRVRGSGSVERFIDCSAFCDDDEGYECECDPDC
jgi:hypothetical protein